MIKNRAWEKKCSIIFPNGLCFCEPGYKNIKIASTWSCVGKFAIYALVVLENIKLFEVRNFFRKSYLIY